MALPTDRLLIAPAPQRVQSRVASCGRCFAARSSLVGFAVNATLLLFRLRAFRPGTRSASEPGWLLACSALRVLQSIRETAASISPSAGVPLRLRGSKTQACFLVGLDYFYRLVTERSFALLVALFLQLLRCIVGFPATSGIHRYRVDPLSASSNSR